MIGLAVGSRECTWVRARARGGGLYVESYGSCPTPAGTVQYGIVRDPGDLGRALREALRPGRLRREETNLCLCGMQFFVRAISLPGVRRRDLPRAVRYQVAAEVPIPLEDLAVDYRFLPGDRAEVVAVATRRTNLQHLVLALRTAGLRPRVIDIEPYCLFRAAARMWPERVPPAVALLSLDPAAVQFSFFTAGILRFHRFFPPDDMGTSGGEAWWQRAAAEAGRSLAFCRQKFGRDVEVRFLATGSAAQEEACAALEGALEMPVQPLAAAPGLAFSTSLAPGAADELARGWPAALGLALRRR